MKVMSLKLQILDVTLTYTEVLRTEMVMNDAASVKEWDETMDPTLLSAFGPSTECVYCLHDFITHSEEFN